jgi:hypothetical protein
MNYFIEVRVYKQLPSSEKQSVWHRLRWALISLLDGKQVEPSNLIYTSAHHLNSKQGAEVGPIMLDDDNLWFGYSLNNWVKSISELQGMTQLEMANQWREWHFRG